MKKEFLKIFDWALAHTAFVSTLAMLLVFIVFFVVGRYFGLSQSTSLQLETLIEARDLIQLTVRNYAAILDKNPKQPPTINEFGYDIRELIAENIPNVKIKLYVKDPDETPGLESADLVDPGIWDKVVNHADYFLDVFKDRYAGFSIDNESGYSLYAYFPLYAKEKIISNDIRIAPGQPFGVQAYIVPVQRFINKGAKYGGNLITSWALILVQFATVFMATIMVYVMFVIAKKLIERLNFLNANLEVIVMERTKQLATSNQEISANWESIQEKRDKIALDEKMATLGLVTSGVANDISEPIASMINFTEHAQSLLLDLRRNITKMASAVSVNFLQNIEEIDLNLRTMEKHNARTEKILESMLEQVRSKASQKTEENIGKIILKILDKIGESYLMGERPINEFPTIELDYADDLKTSLISVDAFEKVIDNIFLNAVYAIYIRYKNDTYKQGVIKIKIAQADQDAVVSFEDNGAGIDVEHMPHIYQPFFTTKPAGVGVGLGLSITYDIVTKEHGGSMEVKSTPQQNTQVIIRIPVASAIA